MNEAISQASQIPSSRVLHADSRPITEAVRPEITS